MFIIIDGNVPSIYSHRLHQYVTYDHFHGYFVHLRSFLVDFSRFNIAGEGFAEKLLSITPLCYLGSISFSVYGWH